MATKNRNDERQVAAMSTEANGESRAEGAQTQTPEAVETPGTPAASDTDMADAAPQRESLAVLAARHRVPSWQQAALCRYMGWADGKMLTDGEYGKALKQLAARHMGGGRKR